jgi:hypothetical protein
MNICFRPTNDRTNAQNNQLKYSALQELCSHIVYLTDVRAQNYFWQYINSGFTFHVVFDASKIGLKCGLRSSQYFPTKTRHTIVRSAQKCNAEMRRL